MKLEFITLCDAAYIYEGKLSLLGSFDIINVPKLPHTLPSFSFAAKVRFNKGEEGNYKIRLLIKNPNEEILGKETTGKIDIQNIVKSASIPFVLNAQNVTFNNYGSHIVKFFLNDEIIGIYTFEVRDKSNN